MKVFILSITLLVIVVSSFAQTGPAGVGSSTSNILWNRSEDISGLNNGDKIASWSDNSGNSNDLTQSDNSFKPEYVTNAQNGFPVVRFNQSNGRLIKNSFSDFPTSAITVIMVNKNDGESEDAMFSYASTAHDNDFLIYDSDALRLYRGGNVNSTLDFSNNAWHIVDASWKSSGGSVRICKDNNISSSFTSVNASGTNITSGGCLAIAAEQDAVNGNYAAGQSHQGDFLEIIVYNIELNLSQRIIVGNYLAAKYDITISNDMYVYQATHSNELAGIGRYDASNIHSLAQSADLITIGNASAMTSDGEYLLFAHDDGSISTWSTTGSAYNTQKLAREWRIDETGDVGTIDITLNTTSLPAVASGSGYTKYGIMLDADGDYTSGAKVYELKLVSGNDYKATGVDVADGDYMSIVEIKPTVYFDETTGYADETSNASAIVSLNYYTASSVTVDYSTSDGTATTANNDYTAVSGSTITFAAGTIEQSTSVTVIDNAVSEGNEDFTISISNPSLGLNLGTSTTYTHTIIDDDNSRKIIFSSSTSSNSESTTSVNIQVEINTSDGSNATTADYTVTGGTAGNTDYTLADGTVSIASGSTTANINITVNNDALDEDDETIIIELSNPSNASLGATIQHTYTIADDDPTPTIYFTTTSSAASEAIVSKNVEVKLSAVSSKDVTVAFASSGTATSGNDYSISTSSPITITAGNTTKDISITINNDVIQEDNETIILTLSGPTNATLGANNTYTYTINDDDLIAYDGPGGVGGSSNLKFWVKAEDIPGSSDGDKVSSWSDKSGNGNSIAQTDDLYKPSYYDDVVNGFPIVRFGVDDRKRLVKTSFSNFPTTEITAYIVRQTSNHFYGEISYASSGNTNDFLLFNYNSNLRTFVDGSYVVSSVNPPDTWAMVGVAWRSSDNDIRFFVNGDKKYTGSLNPANDITQNGCLAIGAEQDAINGSYGTNDDFEGDIAEVLIYNNALNAVRNCIINNYLSAKYDITMDANDKYAGDTPANGDYDFEVIGIGQESTGNHLEAHSSGGLWIKQNSNFDDGDYLFIGHSEVEPQLYTPAEDAGLTSPSIDERWGRDWYFDLTGAINVDLTFDFDEAGMNSSSTPAGTTSNYKLLYRSGTSGNWSIVSSASSKTASQIVFSGQSLPNGDGYYALGTIDASNSPLPIELIGFDAELDGKNVVLDWKTASETNNDYFEIYRSSNAQDWEVVGKVDGNGTTNVIHEYIFTDKKALEGVSYYKLKQIDFDGEYSFSQIRTVDMGNSHGIEIYPNPTNGIIYIDNIPAGCKIELFDMNSRLVDVKLSVENNKANIDMSNLPKSIYFIKIISDNGVEFHKVIRE